MPYDAIGAIDSSNTIATRMLKFPNSGMGTLRAKIFPTLMNTRFFQYCYSIVLICAVGLACGCKSQKSDLPERKVTQAAKKDGEQKPEDTISNIDTADGWHMFRGNPQSTGVAKRELADDLEVQWEFKVKKGAFGGTAAIVASGDEQVVYIGDLDGTLFSLDLNTGDKRWEFISESEIGFSASASYRDGLIYIGDIDGMFYCINDKGEKVWSRQTDAEISSSANFYKENVLFGSQDATLYCLNAKTGEEVWTLEADDQIQCTPTIVDGRAFVAGCDASLHVIVLDSGEEVGSVEIESPTGGTPAAIGDSVYFGTEQAGFLAVQWEQPKLKWRFSDESGAAIRSNPAVIGNHVVYGAGDRIVRSLHPQTKKENWVRTLKAKIESSPVIAGDRVYIGSNDGRLYALKLSSGEVCWEKEFHGGFASSPAVAFGRMIIATERGTVYCLGSKSTSPK